MDSSLDSLIKVIARLPGLGQRSARRMVLQLMKKRQHLLVPLITALQDVERDIKTCKICGNLDVADPCYICVDQKRDAQVVCVVADVSDVWAYERTAAFRGKYHVLGGLLSVMDGVEPDDLSIKQLLHRIETQDVQEIILALNATLDGQTTAHYVANILKPFDIKITRLAQGVPVGGELDYLDENTLTAAMDARLPI